MSHGRTLVLLACLGCLVTLVDAAIRSEMPLDARLVKAQDTIWMDTYLHHREIGFSRDASADIADKWVNTDDSRPQRSAFSGEPESNLASSALGALLGAPLTAVLLGALATGWLLIFRVPTEVETGVTVVSWALIPVLAALTIVGLVVLILPGVEGWPPMSPADFVNRQAIDPVSYKLANWLDTPSTVVWLLAAVGFARNAPPEFERRAALAVVAGWLLTGIIQLA